MVPPFPTAVADTPGGAGQALESEPLIGGQNDQGGTAGNAINSRQAARNRDATSAGQVGTRRTTSSTALTRWTLGVLNVREGGDALPPLPTAE